eukprot:Colp12_sorted_trinity150504_noHs@29549
MTFGFADCLQVHENDKASAVIVHMAGLGNFMGNLHPIGSLHDSVVDMGQANKCQNNLIHALEKIGITVHSVKDLLAHGSNDNMRNRLQLEELACESLVYRLDERSDSTLVTPFESNLLSEEYKRKTVESMSTEQLIDIILTKPIITLVKSSINHPLATEDVAFRPLSNLIFLRDVAICTHRGVVLARPNSMQRLPEVDILHHCYNNLGVSVLGEIEVPGTLEGGDFFPCGPELCFFGVGARTNEYAAKQCMARDWLGTERVAVVKDVFDRSQERMHLSFVFNIISDDCVVLLESVKGDQSPIRRLVDEYQRNKDGKYYLAQQDVEFHAYLVAQGFHVILTEDRRSAYPCHMLNVGNGHVLVEDTGVARMLAKDSRFKGQVQLLNAAPGDHPMWVGGVRCLTQVISRQPRSGERFRPLAPIIRPPLTPNPGAQSTNTILMIAPTSFYQNLQTLADNYFMRANQKLTKQEIQHSALQQYAKLQSVLKGAGVQVLLFNHEAFHDTPDAVFPNNWFSTHSAAEQSERTMCLYPMKAPNRRKERRSDIIDTIKKFYTRQVDFVEGHEEEGRFLESTGSLILDRVHRVAYACVSERTHRDLALQWGEKMGYEMVLFTSVDGAGRLIYHTNVVMALGTSLAIICLATIADQQEREYVVGKLSRYHKILEISLAQMMEFCGNVLEVMDGQGRPTLVMSDASFNAFTPEQKETILANFPGGMLHADLSIIEAIGGGGVRCCMGELF